MSVPAINWTDIVEEAIRRRKEERLSQVALAAIAGVSRPTVVSFERGDTSLQLGKAFDILTALGLLEGTGLADSQSSFVRAARARWQDLVVSLPENDPARLPHGHVSWDYFIEGVSTTLKDLPTRLRSVEAYTGWPPFWVATRPGMAPYNRDGLLECWFGAGRERLFTDAAHSDFWRFTSDARAFLRRGHQEDGPDNLQPGTILDITLPIWRAAEIFLHASQFGRGVGAREGNKVSVRAAWAGLEGRELVHWAKPLLGRGAALAGRARTASASLEIETNVEEIEEALPQLIDAFLAPLYERFDGYQLPQDLIINEISELRRGLRTKG